MNIFNNRSQQEDKKITDLLNKSRTVFKFDRIRIKKQLLNQIEEQQLTQATKLINKMGSVSFIGRHRWATAFGTAILVAVGSGAALSQAGVYQPSQTIDALNHAQEEVMLKLPLPAAQRASIQMRVAERRARKFESAVQQNNQVETKKDALEETSIIMNDAINKISESKLKQSARGRIDAEQKYSHMLERLAEMADQQEQTLTEWMHSKESTIPSAELQHHLENIQSYKHKARTNLNLPQLNNDESSEPIEVKVGN